MKTKTSGVACLSISLSAALIVGFYPTNAKAVGCSFALDAAPVVCGDSIVQGGSAFLGNVIASPNPVLSEHLGGPVAVGAVGSGPGGLAGAATAAGTFGEAHVSASANSGQFNKPTGVNGDQANVSARGQLGFIDGFHINSALNVRITTSMDATFTGQETSFGDTFAQPGAAGINFVFGYLTGKQTLIDNDGSGSQSFSLSQDLLLQPGDYEFLFALTANARAVVDNFSIIPFQTADASNTGHLFFDVITPDASLTFLSGHDYSSLAATSETPLPAALPLFASGLGAMGLLGWRRKRKVTATIVA